ncbi:MAG: signal peptidase I, partial [Desulfurococcales archaeon]|nr:signal peptidase I [Desulfurococcales archaeon]
GVVLAAAGASAPRAVGARVRGALAYGAVLLVPLLLLAASGARVVVVTSGSMEPSLGVGDLAVVLPGSPGPGSVVLYRHEGGLVIHRVVEDHGSYLVTRGDANPGPDPWRVGAGSVVGVMRLRVPWAGRPLLWLRAVLGGL